MTISVRRSFTVSSVDWTFFRDTIRFTQNIIHNSPFVFPLSPSKWLFIHLAVNERRFERVQLPIAVLSPFDISFSPHSHKEAIKLTMHVSCHQLIFAAFSRKWTHESKALCYVLSYSRALLSPPRSTEGTIATFEELSENSYEIWHEISHIASD